MLGICIIIVRDESSENSYEIFQERHTLTVKKNTNNLEYQDRQEIGRSET